MTKRFELVDFGFIRDTATGKLLNPHEIEDKMNALFNENTELKEILNVPSKYHKMNNKELSQLCHHISLKMGELQKENRRLKEQL